MPAAGKYSNPRVSFDGLNWFLTIGIECEAPEPTESTHDGIGIDLGVKDLAICSTGQTFKNINKSSRQSAE
ncbi:MAG: transposase [Synergistaceae bacterium]|nr:transposase [Synergistaceae bacterium]